MREWDLRSRLVVLLLATVGLLGLVGAWALHQVGQTVAAVGTVYRDRLVPMQQLRTIERAYRTDVSDAVAQLEHGALDVPTALKRIAGAEKTVATLWAAYKTTELVPQERELIVQAERAMRAADQVLARVRGAALRGSLDSTASAEVDEALAALEPLLEQLIEVQLQASHDESERAAQLYARAVWIVGSLTALALLVGSMLAASVLAKHRRLQALAEAQTTRMAAFYRALSRTNQLIVRSPSEAQLYEEVCRICVETGHARVACVDRLEVCLITRLTAAGPAAELFAGLTTQWDLDDPESARSMVGSALNTGTPMVFNDYQHDPRSARFHERAVSAGIRSAAAFPLRRGSRIVGALVLYAGEARFFDESLRDLIAEMANDVSYALDRIDRDDEVRQLNLHLEDRVAERTAQLQSAVTELELARDAAESATRAKGEFVANMSHEIRTPINAVLGLTDLALRTELDARQRNYLQKTQLAADALLQLVDRILDFSKIEAQRLELEAVPFVLDDLTEQVVAIVGEKARLKGLDFRVQHDPAVPARLVGDVQRLRQVLINLCNNAVKFTDAGQVCLVVEGVDRPADARDRCRMRLTVRDTGIGLSAAQIARLFQPFTQADASTSRQYGGTGLGLAISKQLVELMGGSLEVRSTPGKGSEFFFTLEIGVADAAGSTVAAAPVASSFDALRGRRVLLVEDNDLNQLVAGDLLRDVAGMEVVIAGNGEQALQALSETRFDVVLCDVQMPGMDGYELTRRIRARPDAAATPIVAVTAHASARDRDLCLAAGMDEYLTKPFDPQRLFNVLVGVTGGTWTTPDRAATNAPARGGVLFKLGLERCLGRRELYEKIVRRYLGDRADLPVRIRDAVDAGRPELASMLSHNLISSAGTLGAMRLSDQARELQQALDAGQSDRCTALIAAVAREHEVVGAALTAYLERSTTAA